MAYQRHQLRQAERMGLDPELIDEMRYEVEYNELMDNYEPPEVDFED